MANPYHDRRGQFASASAAGRVAIVASAYGRGVKVMAKNARARANGTAPPGRRKHPLGLSHQQQREVAKAAVGTAAITGAVLLAATNPQVLGALSGPSVKPYRSRAHSPYGDATLHDLYRGPVSRRGVYTITRVTKH